MAYRFLAGVVVLAMIFCSLPVQARTLGRGSGIGHGNKNHLVLENDDGFILNRFKNLESTAHSPGIGHGGKNPPALENDASFISNCFKDLGRSIPSPSNGHAGKNPPILENDAGFILNHSKDLERTAARSPGMGHDQKN